MNFKILLTLLLMMVCCVGMGSADPYLGNYTPYLQTMLHMNGTNGGTTFTDDTGLHAYTATGATTSTTDPKFGNASYSGGAGKYISTTNSGDFDFGSGDFTIVTWLKRNDLTSDTYVMGKSDSVPTNYWMITFHNYAGPTNRGINFQQSNSACLLNDVSTYDWSDTTTWHQYVVTRTGSTANAYVDGSLVATNAACGAMPAVTGGFAVGRVGDYAAGNFNGYVDETAIWKGVGIPIAELYPQTLEIGTSAVTPTASFTTNTTSGFAPLPVQFNDTSATSITGWAYSFVNKTPGNNTEVIFSTSQNPVHAFGVGEWDTYLNVTNTSGYKKTGATTINVTSGTPSIVSSFTTNATTGTTSLAVQFTDTSTGSHTTWNYTFTNVSGNNTPVIFSTLRNPIHMFGVGNFDTSLNVTNATGSFSVSSSQWINVTTLVPSGYNQQDLTMTPQYTLTVHIVDSSTNLPIPVVLVTDSLGNNQTTSTGTFTGTYAPGLVVLYLASSGYDSTSASYIMDSDRDETVQMTKTTATTQGSTTWYVPKTIEFRVVNYANNQMSGVNLTAKFNSSSTLLGGMDDLKTWYGMNPTAANEAANGTLIMSGITDTQGVVVLTMLSTLSYDVYVTSGGTTNYFNVHPQNSPYLLRFVTLPTADTSLTHCVYDNGNTHTGLAAQDPYNMTLMWSYQDTCGLTTALDYIVKDVNNGSFIIYNYHLTPVTSGIYVNNLTLSNTRGANYIWYENATRSV